MKNNDPPKLKKFPAAKQRRLDELLDRNSEGTITPGEKTKLEQLVAEAEELMVGNAKLLAGFSQRERTGVPPRAVPVTVWLNAHHAER